MQKIDKTQIFSTVYKKWEEGCGPNHPSYNSSNGKYYYDVVMNLFHCQKGVCAYSEISLCDDDYYQFELWNNGKYSSQKPEFSGALDHFDPNLKPTQGWLWSNLFMVSKDINDKHKREKAVDYILKPDLNDYDPFRLLEYDNQLHVFIANTDLDEVLQQRINDMLEVLGINLSWIKKSRKNHLRRIIEKIQSGLGNWEHESAENHQFFTALEMCRQKMQES